MEKQLSRVEINSICMETIMETIKETYEKKGDPYDFQLMIGAILGVYDRLIDKFNAVSLSNDSNALD